MLRSRAVALAAGLAASAMIASCGAEVPPAATTPSAPPATSSPLPEDRPADAPPDTAEPGQSALAEPAPTSAAPPEAGEPVPASGEPELWLKGSTHVHARPSGDSSEPIDKVVAWYEAHGYDFIALTDHNRVTEVAGVSTPKLLVLPGIELTHNPTGCLPIGDPSKKCRIHVNALGVTARPPGKLEWAERRSHQRIDMYQAALRESSALGAAVMQINHPQWYWGMSAELLVELAHRGVRLVEIANVQFVKWNVGDTQHASTESLWDAALERGATLWGVASDDAHDYEGRHQKWPPGGGWVVVHARRDARAILDALAAGHFYSSTGVVLSRDEVVNQELVVEVAADQPGSYQIAWVENGKLVGTTPARLGRRALPPQGYLRAVITRDDGKRAWIQPVRRAP